MLPAVLKGYAPDEVNPPLRFCDSITIIPDAVNGLAAYDGSMDGRAWVQILDPKVEVPPNLSDCQWKIVPQRDFSERTRLKKIAKKGTWDQGTGLPWPDVPEEGDDLDELAEQFMRDNLLLTVDKKISPSQKLQVKEVLSQLKCVREEHEENIAEEVRQVGKVLHYGDCIQLLHVSTDSYVSVAKCQALEKGSKRVEFVPSDEGSELCIFVIRPAYKAFTFGDVVNSGDLVVLQLKKPLGSMPYFLHMSDLGQAWKQENLKESMRALRVDSKNHVVDAEELNASSSSNASDMTFFRLLVFQPCEELQPGTSTFLTGDVMTFYHKEAEAYLHFDMADLNEGRQPCFRQSTRTSDKARKKSTWMWTVESVRLLHGAGRVRSSDANLYRIKHVISNTYLKCNQEALEATSDYSDPATLFSIKSFTREARDDTAIPINSLVMIRSAGEGSWLTQVNNPLNGAGQEDSAATAYQGVASEGVLESRGTFVTSAVMPDRDALLVAPIKKASTQSVVQIRRALVQLSYFAQLLDELEDVAETGAAGEKAPPDLPIQAANVLQVIEKNHDQVSRTLRRLVLNCTMDSDTNPLSREGEPNRLMQKLLREQHAIHIVMHLIALPFKKGLCLSWCKAKDPRLRKTTNIITLMYRLMKQMVKGDGSGGRNSWELFKHIDLIKSHLGSGLACNDTLNEMFQGKRQILKRIEEEDIQRFAELLDENKDPQYIDFLATICTCDGQPLPRLQSKICEQIFNLNSHLLPSCRIDASGKQCEHHRLGIHLPGTTDQDGNDFWIDVGKFHQNVTVSNGKQCDLASTIENVPASDLNDQQKLLRYFLRCLRLYSQAIQGRNQTALVLLLDNPRLSFKFEDIFSVMRNEYLPPLVRARFTTLMLHLYVDREPQTSNPQVLYTRAWSKVEAEVAEVAGGRRGSLKFGAEANLECSSPVDLVDYLVKGFPDLWGVRDKWGHVSVNHATLGQLELVGAMVDLCDWLVDFSFLLPDRHTLKPDFSSIQAMMRGIFKILDTLGGGMLENEHQGSSREDGMRIDVRMKALQLMSRLLNLRANYRISRALHAWEQVFHSNSRLNSRLEPWVQAGSHVSNVTHDAASAAVCDMSVYKQYFRGHDKVFRKLEKALFDENCVSPVDLNLDRFKHDTIVLLPKPHDYCVKVLLNLCHLNSTKLTNMATKTLIKQLSQRATLLDDLALVQMLVYPAALAVYSEACIAIRRISSLKKHLALDKPEAYTEAMELLASMTSYMKISTANALHIVQQNQKIMLNLEMDEAVMDCLRLPLERDTSLRDAGEIEADVAVNVPRRLLFQAACDFLEALCAHGNKRAQQKLFPYISSILDHMGVQALDVAQVVRQIVCNNSVLSGEVSESVFRHVIYSILSFGRKPHYLSFFEVFLIIDGIPSRRNQDKILRLLLEDKDALIDLTCDYTNCKFLSKTDERFGMKRLELMALRDHKTHASSLLKYHYLSVHILACCCTGQNPRNKAKLAELIPFHTVVSNILCCHLKDDGTADEDVDYDTLCYIKLAWTKMLETVFFSSNDSNIIKQVGQERSVWRNTASELFSRKKSFCDEDPVSCSSSSGFTSSLMQEWSSAISKLTDRLSKIQDGPLVKVPLFPPQVEAQASTLFAMFDVDESGTLSTSEMERALSNLGFAPSEITEIFMEADKNHNGVLSVEEFRDGVMPLLCDKMGLKVVESDICEHNREKSVCKQCDEESRALALKASREGRQFPPQVEAQASTLFAMFDVDASGTLLTSEVERALSNLSFAPSEITEIFMEADKNHNGVLSFEEFRDGVMPLLCERMGFKLDDKEESRALSKSEKRETGGREVCKTRDAAHRISLCGGADRHEDFADDVGKDLGTHYLYVKQIVWALTTFFDLHSPSFVDLSEDSAEVSVCRGLLDAAAKLHKELVRLKLDAHKDVIVLVRQIAERGVHHCRGHAAACARQCHMHLQVADNGALVEDASLNVGQQFQIGWRYFRTKLADLLQVAPTSPQGNSFSVESEVMGLAMIYGSRKSASNNELQSLRVLMELLCHESCEESVRSLGVRVVRAILYMNPDSNNQKQQRAEYARCHADEDPSAALVAGGDAKFKALQVQIARCGGVQVVLSCVLSKDRETVLGAFRLGNTLLVGGNDSVQNLFYKHLAAASSQDFFSKLRDEFNNAINAIKEMKRKAKQALAEHLRTGKRIKSSANDVDKQIMDEVMTFMRRCCMGQHKDLQNIFRVQRINRVSHDFYQEAVQYLTVLEPDIKNAIKSDDGQTSSAFIQGFEMLSDSMKGPNYENKQSIVKTGIFNLADRVMGKIKFETMDPTIPFDVRKGIFKKGKVMPADDAKEEPLLQAKDIYRQNLVRCRLKCAVLECVHCFLEGVVNDSIPLQMLATVNWTSYAAQMTDCWNFRERNDEVPVDGSEDVNIVDEGIQYYFLFKFLEFYETTETMSQALESAPAVVTRFFEARKGFVEITRDSRIERIFFRLPEDAIQGNSLDKDYTSLYDTQRDDPDKKTKGFLENMVRLVEEERILDRIRCSMFAFTINRWDFICTFSFAWGLMIHAVMILGSYAPFGGIGDIPALDDYKVSAMQNGSAIGRIFVGILPLVEECVRYMCYMNVGVCGIRYFCFLWARVQLIVLQGQSLEEGQQEDDASKLRSSSVDEEEEEDHEDQQVLFVADLASSKSARKAKDEEDEEDKQGSEELSLNALAVKRGLNLLPSAKSVLCSSFFWYETFFCAMTVLAVVFDQPLYTIVFVLEIFNFTSSQTVVLALRSKALEMINTLVLGLAIMYIWMIMGVVLFRSGHVVEGEDVCTNMFQCSMAYIYIALRGDGVKDLIADPSVPLNIVDSVMPDQGFFLPYLLWDMSFQWLFIYVLLAIITGIVIDAFSGLRDEKEKADADLKAFCFVCNLDRFRIDQAAYKLYRKSDGFDRHVRLEHNPRWYLFFLIYIYRRPDQDLSGQERYVKSKVWPGVGPPSYSWIPRKCTASMNQSEQGEDGGVAEAVARLESRYESLHTSVTSALTRIESCLKTP